MSVLLIVEPKCTLAASHAASESCWVWVCAADSITVKKKWDIQTVSDDLQWLTFKVIHSPIATLLNAIFVQLCSSWLLTRF